MATTNNPIRPAILNNLLRFFLIIKTRAIAAVPINTAFTYITVVFFPKQLIRKLVICLVKEAEIIINAPKKIVSLDIPPFLFFIHVLKKSLF
jgi:hypothetical protein